MPSVEVQYSPPAGLNLVELSGSVTANAQFDTQPVADEQILYPADLTVDAQLNISGPDGAYVLYHVMLDGTTAHKVYVLATPDETAPILSSPSATVTGSTTLTAQVTTDEANGTLFVLASTNATESQATVQGSGVSQTVTETGAQSVSLADLTPATGYYVHFVHVDTAGNVSSVVSTGQVLTQGSAPGPQSGTAVGNWTAGEGYTMVTLAAGFDRYAFQEWPIDEPQVGWQLVTWTADGYFDSLGNYYSDVEHIHDVWVVDLAGTITHITLKNTDLPLAEPSSDTTPDAFTVQPLTAQPLDEYVEFAPIPVSGIDAGEEISVVVTGAAVEYAVDTGSGYGAFTAISTNVQLGYLVKPRILTADDFETEQTGSISIGSESSSLSATTRSAVLPNLTTQLPDLDLGQGEAVNIDLDNHFSGAGAYDLSGLPEESGLTFTGSVLSGSANAADIAASPFTLTATAYSAEGSIQDEFAVTVVDDLPPVISIYPLTTLETAPVVSGSAGDAVSLTLVVNGVTYTPVPSGGTWSQQLNTLPLNTYTMTLNGQDAAGNAAIAARATLRVVAEIIAGTEGLFRSLFTPEGIALFRKLFR